MLGLLGSMMRFSTAIAAFSLQQVQNAVTSPASALEGLHQVRDALDSASLALGKRSDQ